MVQETGGQLLFTEADCRVLGVPMGHTDRVMMAPYYYGVAHSASQMLLEHLRGAEPGEARTALLQAARHARTVVQELGALSGLAQGVEIDAAVIELNEELRAFDGAS